MPFEIKVIGLFASLLLNLALPISAYAANESIVDLSAYEGHWQRIDDGDSDEARLSAIGTALESLSWIMRRMASPILRKTTAPPTEVDFSWDGERLYQLSQATTGDDGIRSLRPIDLDGRPLVWQDDRGVEFSSAWAWTGSGLRVRWEQHQAKGSNVYLIDTRDQTLIVAHTINVTAISNVHPIVFLSRFSRSSAENPLQDKLDPSTPIDAD